jgi:hypothetical protein
MRELAGWCTPTPEEAYERFTINEEIKVRELRNNKYGNSITDRTKSKSGQGNTQKRSNSTSERRWSK